MRVGQYVAVMLVCLFLTGGCAASRSKPEPWMNLAEAKEKIIEAKEQKTALEMAPEEEVEPEEAEPRIRELEIAENGRNPRLTKVLKKRPLRESETGKAAGEGILLNFDNADIYEVIQVVAETLDMNYIIDPQVRGVVNIRSGAPVPRDQLYDVFKKILNINGLDIISEGEYYYIYVAKNPSAQAVFCPDQMGKLEDSSRMVMQIAPIIYLASDEAEKLILPYLSDQGSTYNLAAQNTLIINDFESKVLDVLAILAKLDVSPLSNFRMRLVRVENAPLFDLSDEVTNILNTMGLGGEKGLEGIAVLPMERINSLLLVSKSDYMLDQVDRWIADLDVTPSGASDNIYFYNVRNTVASELVDLVNVLIGKEGSAVRSQQSESQAAASQTNAGEGAGGTPRPRLRTGTTAAATAESAGLQFAGEPVLIADDARNLVLIRALPADNRRLIKLLERLDSLPAQVLIEVLVAEVTLTDQFQFGVEWALKSNSLTMNGTDYVQGFRSTNFAGLSDNLSSLNGFTYSILKSGEDVRALLNALASDTNVSILSSPQILVLNNEPASINVGDQVPIITSQITSAEATTATQTSLTQSIQYRDTGVILNVTPRININGIIILEIQQQVSNARPGAAAVGVDSPVISTRELKTKLAVKDGQSIMMGGMIRKDTNVSESGIPLLKDIPALGWLFKSHDRNTTNTELLVMITPYVIESEDVLGQYFQMFNQKVKELRQELSESPKEPGERVL